MRICVIPAIDLKMAVRLRQMIWRPKPCIGGCAVSRKTLAGTGADLIHIVDPNGAVDEPKNLSSD